MKIYTKSLEDTKTLALCFAKAIPDEGLFATLTGDIGAGKTQFIRYVLEYLEVEDKITSPSFVILNEYKSKRFPIYHFDLYRLEEKGLKSIVSELREYSRKGVLTFIEWAEFAHNEIPNEALKINVEYDDTDIDIRIFDFSEENRVFFEEFKRRIKDNERFNNMFGIE